MAYAPNFKNEMVAVDTISHSGAASNTVNVGFKPSWVFAKTTTGSDGGFAFGEPTGLVMIDPEDTLAPAIVSEGLTSFVANGFTHGTSNKLVINNKQTVYQCWKGSGSTGAVNSSGTITANVSANASIGFSITKYTGNGTADSTIPHGLGKKPEVIFFLSSSQKQDVGAWCVDIPNKSTMRFANGDILQTRQQGGKTQQTSILNSTDPTKTLITLGNNVACNDNGETFAAIAWRSVKGVSKAGYYLGTAGNEKNINPFVYTGFKPSMLIIKSLTTIGSNNWRVINLLQNNNNADTTGRRLFNPKGMRDDWRHENGDARSHEINLYSNGFGIVGKGNEISDNEVIYFYMAFAKEAIVSTNNIPTTGV
tara:strand:- start:42 stop:1139 length:1098 start_codon:yes stop_codon:yes gene_type:complete